MRSANLRRSAHHRRCFSRWSRAVAWRGAAACCGPASSRPALASDGPAPSGCGWWWLTLFCCGGLAMRARLAGGVPSGAAAAGAASCCCCCCGGGGGRPGPSACSCAPGSCAMTPSTCCQAPSFAMVLGWRRPGAAAALLLLSRCARPDGGPSCDWPWHYREVDRLPRSTCPGSWPRNLSMQLACVLPEAVRSGQGELLPSDSPNDQVSTR